MAPCNKKPHQHTPSARGRKVQFKSPPPQRCKRTLSKSRPAPTRTASPERDENKLLQYLMKLRNLFCNNPPHPQAGSRENSATKLNKLHHDYEMRHPQRASTSQPPYRYTSSNPPRPRDDSAQDRMYKVVSAILDYGFANNVLERKGDYFTLKYPSRNSSKVRDRAPTPGPAGPRYCGRCCNVHKHLENDLRCSGLDNMSVHSLPSGRVQKRVVCPRHPDRRLPGRTRAGLKMKHCPQCRMLERRR